MSPLPRGEYATILTPSSLAVFKSLMDSSSISKVKGEYSTSMAEMGWTACALRRVKAEISESPMYLTFPALERVRCQVGEPRDGIITHLTSFAISATVCSIGTAGSARWR